MRVDGFDPGGTTGVALFDGIKPIEIRQLERDDLDDWLIHEYEPPEVMVVEDYRILPRSMTGGWSHEWDKGETLRIIGSLEFFAKMKGVKIVLQSPHHKGMANQLVFGKPYNKNSKDPQRHAKDALLHVRWYYHTNGLYLGA
jgi:hypothetical protein